MTWKGVVFSAQVFGNFWLKIKKFQYDVHRKEDEYEKPKSQRNKRWTIVEWDLAEFWVFVWILF